MPNFIQVKTASDLKYNVEQGSDRHFFTRDSMRFFGDTMRNYGVRRTTINTSEGLTNVFELYRRKPVKHGLKDSAYFNASDFSREFVREVTA